MAPTPTTSDGMCVCGSDDAIWAIRSKKLPETPSMPNSFGSWVDAM